MLTTPALRAPTIGGAAPGDMITSLAIGYSQPITITTTSANEDDPRYVVVTYTSATGRTYVRTIHRDTRVTPWDGPVLNEYEEWDYRQSQRDE